VITIYSQIARDKHNEMVRNAEQSHSNRPMRRKQPNVIDQLKSQLADWAELARPQRNRAKRA
jgi:hypothetical protein